MAIPAVAPMLDPEEVSEGEGGKVMIDCSATDCKFNMGNKCTAPSIKVSSGPDAKCETYDPGEGGSAPTENKIPRPPLPPMQM